MHRYSRAQYEEALNAFSVSEGGDAGAMPPSLAWFLGSRENARAQMIARWSALSLEERISAIAVSIGLYVPGDLSNARHVITYGYEMLCRTQQLSMETACLA